MMAANDEPRWMLGRGNRDPHVWPFPNREAAEEFQLDHALIDWRVEEVKRTEEHTAVCGRCFEPWPCRHEKLERHARSIEYRSDHTCHRCGGEVCGEVRLKGAGEFGLDVVYHSRQGACRRAARRHAESLGLTGIVVRIDREDEYLRERREWRGKVATMQAQASEPLSWLDASAFVRAVERGHILEGDTR